MPMLLFTVACKPQSKQHKAGQAQNIYYLESLLDRVKIDEEGYLQIDLCTYGSIKEDQPRNQNARSMRQTEENRHFYNIFFRHVNTLLPLANAFNAFKRE